MEYCHSCSHSFAQDLGAAIRPWCPHCGADLKSRSASHWSVANLQNEPQARPAAAPPMAAVQAPASLPESHPIDRPIFFEVRGGKARKQQRLYRVYLFEDEFFFIDFGSDVPSAAQNIAMSQFGLIGGLVAGHLAEKQRRQNADRCWQLDIATIDELLELVESNTKHWRLSTNDVASSKIVALSGWERFWKGARSAGALSYVCADGSQFVFDFLKPEGMRLALEHLPEMLNGRVDVNAAFDRRHYRYVRSG